MPQPTSQLASAQNWVFCCAFYFQFKNVQFGRRQKKYSSCIFYVQIASHGGGLGGHGDPGHDDHKAGRGRPTRSIAAWSPSRREDCRVRRGSLRCRSSGFARCVAEECRSLDGPEGAVTGVVTCAGACGACRRPVPAACGLAGPLKTYQGGLSGANNFGRSSRTLLLALCLFSFLFLRIRVAFL